MFCHTSWHCLSAHMAICSLPTKGMNQDAASGRAQRQQVTRLSKHGSFTLPSPGPRFHILSLPNYLNVKVLSCTGMPLDSCILELWGCVACRYQPKSDVLSFQPHMGRRSGEVSTLPGKAGGIGLGTEGKKCDFSSF